MKAIKLTIEDYNQLAAYLKQTGYHEVSAGHKKKSFYRLGLEAPRSLEGSEVCWRYSNNGYTAFAWVSFLKKEGKFRDVGTDAGWPIITKGDNLAYSPRPLSRTAGFVLRMARYAWINKWRIDNIPLCPCCAGQMEIYRKQGTRQYMYACKKTDAHSDKKWRFRDWDFGLPPKAQQFVMIRRKKTSAYNKKNEKLGKNPRAKALTRKRWTVTKPQNKL